jgi:hypothetical protein
MGLLSLAGRAAVVEGGDGVRAVLSSRLSVLSFRLQTILEYLLNVCRLQLCQVGIELIFGDAFAAVELIDAAANLGVDRVPVLQEPSILFFLGFEQAEQDLFDAAGAGCLDCFWILAYRAASRISMFMDGSFGLRVRERVR